MFTIYRSYTYKTIEKLAAEKELSITQYGPDIIGENFVVLNHPERDVVYSFVLESFFDTGGFVYKCIYIFN